jgi:DNA polymerase III subunit delta
MQIKLDALSKHLSTKLAAAYLVAGEEDLLRLEALDQIRRKAKDAGFLEREVFDVNSSLDFADVKYSTQALGLFSTKKILELRLNALKLDSNGSAFVTEFCENTSADILLIISAPEWNKQALSTAWGKAIDQIGCVITIWPLSANELSPWLHARGRAAGISFDPEAMQLLVDRVEGNLLAAAQDIDKLALLAPGKHFGVFEVDDAIADSAHFDAFRLLDAALSGYPGRTTRIIEALQGEGIDPVREAFGWTLRQIESGQKMSAGLEQGQSIDSMLESYRLFGPRAEPMRRALKRLTPNDWQARYIECAKVDQALKGRRQDAASGWLELERLLLRLALPAHLAARFAA